MNRSKRLSEKAVAHFLKGHNCAQSVLLTMLEDWGVKSELVPKIAAGFGGGIGRCGSLCGVVTGGVMAIGVKFGTNKPSAEKRKEVYKLAQEFYRQFEKENGSVLCRQLIGYNLSDPKELKRAREAKIFDEKCTVFISEAIRTLVKLCEAPR